MKHAILRQTPAACLRTLLRLPRQMPLSVFALLLVALGSGTAQAQTFTEQSLHDFSGNHNTDGANSYASLLALNGKFYGTTYQGGTHSEGTIFIMNSDGTGYQTLYNFQAGSNDGANPYASLIVSNGKLYGTAYTGGTYNGGTVFVINPDGSGYQTLYNFGGTSADGANPYASLTAANGNLYGTTSEGGTYGRGTVYALNPDGTGYQPVYSFQGGSGDGGTPLASLLAVNGKLYGTTRLGGSNGYGTIFVNNPDGTGHQTLYSFTNANGDGAYPFANLIDVNGVLYGTTLYGGSNYGTVFAINPDGTGYKTLHVFNGNSSPDGADPYDGLIDVNGKLYGTTYGGGTGYGTVFAINPNGTGFQTVYSFQSGSNGYTPYGGLIALNGNFYGTTEQGGIYGAGTVFSLNVTIDPPTANNDNGRGIANHTIIIAAPGVLTNDNNGGDPNTTAAIVTNPTHGTITFKSDGSFNYTPNTGFVGTDSFTYKDTNSAGTSNTATCSLTIGPVAYNDNGRTYFNTSVVITAPGVLGNDITGGLSTTATLVTNPSHGTITFNSNGSFVYTPPSGFLGTDSFTYKITNSAGTSAPATCTLTVQARTPVANNDAGRVTHNTTLTISAPGVLGNDNPGTTGTVTAAIVANPTHGTITFHTDGSFVYKPNTGFIGTDSFTYKDTNSVGTSNTATCTLTVQ